MSYKNNLIRMESVRQESIIPCPERNGMLGPWWPTLTPSPQHNVYRRVCKKKNQIEYIKCLSLRPFVYLSVGLHENGIGWIYFSFAQLLIVYFLFEE